MDITEIREKMQYHFGFNTFKGKQEEVILNLLAGKDTFVLMPTGGGKSLCYQLPALLQEGTAIVISPLIALMKNQVDAMRGFNQKDSIAHFYNSSLTKAQATAVRKDVLDGKTKLLYVAPESLTREANVEFLKQIKVSFYAIDEAHCISEWGHDFRPEYRNIRTIIEHIQKAPVIALTATATPKVQQDILKNLGIPNADVFKSSFNRENLYYEIRPKQDPVKMLIRFINENKNKSGIIYCLSRKKVEELAETLQVNGINAAPYHAGLEATKRSATQDLFLKEEIKVIVATIAFGMGIDKPDVRFVVHYDMPKSLEAYYQETGRAGRDGGEGKCIAFYSYKDIEKLERFMQGKPVAEQEIGAQLIEETMSYAESSICRRISLLNYFGEDYTQEECGNCDNCLNPKEEFEGKDYLLTAMKVIKEVKQKYKIDHITNILSGVENATIKSFKHNELKTFGIGKEKDPKFWSMIIRRALIEKLLEKEIEQYGILQITKLGEEFIKNPKPFPVSENNVFDIEETSSSAQVAGGATDATLSAMLLDLRNKVAKKENLPPYIIFQEPSIHDMATQYPISLEELARIQGVGTGKAERYGQKFVELIAKYVEENEIDRPQDMVLKSVANKSQHKIYIISAIDSKKDLETLATSQGLSFDDLIKEMEAIVFSGTRLNIDYYLDEILDEEYQEELYEYFREAETDKISVAYEEFEGDYSEEEIRLIRLKFYSENGI